MGEKDVTTMVIKVDLDCKKCRKKIKKVLCKIPEIQSQEYDEKTNTVTITVVCCSPEKVKQKICCKGGETVKCIEIKKVPKKCEEPEKQKKKCNEHEKTEETKKQKEEETKKQTEEEKPPNMKCTPPPCHGCPSPPKPCFPRTCCTECSQRQGGGEKQEPEKSPTKKCTPPPSHGCPPLPMPCFPRTCCTECSQGQGEGPCYSAPCYYQWHGRLVCDSWGGGAGCRGGCYVSRCHYLSEENLSGCTVM